MNEIKNINPELGLDKVILIGHSNGGDSSMMFAALYPNKVSKIVSLDSRRYPFPRNTDAKILRIGASDDEPDEGVVPNSGVRVIYFDGARHIDLCDSGNVSIKNEIQKSIVEFLHE